MTDTDAAVVGRQIGRDPRGDVAVVSRCVYGLPAAIRTQPRLRDGTPFPTLYYLTCPVAVRAIGALEAEGAMRGYEDLLAQDDEMRRAYEEAHARYKRDRDAIEQIDEPMTAGGMPSRVKCLHALVAHDLADANPIGAKVRAAIEPLACPGPCVRGEPPARVAGHPGFKGKKRRR